MKKFKRKEINKVTRGELENTKKQAWKIVTKDGNILIFAIGLLIGSTIGLVINSLANDIIGQAFAKMFNFDNLKYLSAGTTKWDLIKMPNPDWYPGAPDTIQQFFWVHGLPLNGIMYGKFLAALISFIIITVILFVAAFTIISIWKRFKKKEEAAPAAPSTDQLILEELRKLNAMYQPKKPVTKKTTTKKKVVKKTK